MVFALDEEIGFPDPRLGEPDGLLAIGGDLSMARLMLAYSYGIFPWYSFRDSEDPYWYCPMERFVIFPEEIHISHSMRTLMNKGIYRVTVNKDFEGVISGCSKLRIDQEGAWLGDDMMTAYKNLHDAGYAISVEVWDESDELVGGLYGVMIGDGFFGESMFSLKPSASKLALIELARRCPEWGCKLIDCQLETSHLRSMGGRFIPYSEYLQIINPEGYRDLYTA